MIKDLIKKIAPAFLLDYYYLFWPFLGAVFYRFPSRKLRVIGVTGTNGKSTVVLMIAAILEEAGFKTASLSSIKFRINDKEWVNPLKMTMPGRFKIQKFLRQSADSGCQYAVLEVTSEGIEQYRHKFINFDTVVFTNLSKEHIERHGSFEKYRRAKGELFKSCRNIHVVNLDDENKDFFWSFPAKKKIGYGCDASLKIKLPGTFNVYNASAALQVGLAQGIDETVCRRALVGIENIPGRAEKVIKEPFKVFVDYAHTPVALENIYKTLPGRKVCLLGAAGGGRDRWKRPELGRIAANYCDIIILTNEDPYDEPPEKIIDEVAVGAPHAQKILDRRQAIKKALGMARAGDTVIITGKGSEPWMCLARGKKVPWSDREVVREEYAKIRIEV